MSERLDWTCQVCGSIGFDDGSDGFFYCTRCGSQAEDIIDTAVADEDLGENAIYLASHRRSVPTTVSAAERISHFQQAHQSQFWDSIRALEEDDNEGDGIGPTGPSDFGTSGSRTVGYEEYYEEIRLRYVMGIQIMIQLQCKALVEKFNVSPLIVGLIGPIWMRFVAITRVFDDGWADQVIHESESQKQGQADDFQPSAKHRAEPHNILGQRVVLIWYRSLSKTIPLPYSLVISFLVCHMAREAVLPTDILKWALEGKLPYFAAFVEIEKQLGPPSVACPFSTSRMFRPTQAISLQKLESTAASIAQTIGLELPPVNFYAIASRYLRQLSLPVENILPQACCLYEWSIPAELWLSTNEGRLPSRVCVMAILIVTIRILYNINGFGKWEMELSNSNCSSSPNQNGETDTKFNSGLNDDANEGVSSNDSDDLASVPCDNRFDVLQSELNVAELLLKLEAKYDDLADTYDYSKDLPTYLQYCKDVVFAGLEPSFEDHEEEKIIEDFWDFYQSQKSVEPSDGARASPLGCSSGSCNKRSRYGAKSTKEYKKLKENGCTTNPSYDGGSSLGAGPDSLQHSMSWSSCASKDQNSLSVGQPSMKSYKDKAIRRLKSNMEENKFCYIPPRVNVKRSDYLHYVRKKDEGAYAYAAHADYYIILRSCARAAQVDLRIMHVGVLNLERRLVWIENRIDQCLEFYPANDSCGFCSHEAEQDAAEESMDL
ncbi:unnamed protein product [Ilex paraguariensis]|uniref:TATA box-binding protein-associated factor RNA polymerase I subunit B n=1 Tax=Ilex paraguariensis TaxID=185542 RepID=A0ABC8QYC7_9AQUA